MIEILNSDCKNCGNSQYNRIFDGKAEFCNKCLVEIDGTRLPKQLLLKKLSPKD